MSQKNENFIDKTFTIIADVLLKTFPASKEEKQAFFYYREGLAAQSAGEHAEALENYYEAFNYSVIVVLNFIETIYKEQEEIDRENL